MDLSSALTLICLLVAAWLFVFGACVGSFLNVVIWRLPAGMSLVSPPSACPRCGTAIRAIDNIPLCSWLMLGGNCRGCSAPISLRYPGVEFLVACGAVAIGAGEVFSLGRNLPTPIPLVSPRLSPIDEMTLILWGIAAFHFLLWVTLVAMAFIEYDGESVPWTLTAPALLIGIVAPLFWPELRPLSYQAACPAIGLGSAMPAAGWARCAWGDTLAGLAIGGATGVGLSFLIALVTRRKAGMEIVALALVGHFLGWQSAVALALGATVFWPLLALPLRWIGAALPWTGALAAALIPFLLAWKWLASWCG